MSYKNYKFSLIVCTFGRVEELKLLFKSLKYQSYKNFEVIVVDQNIGEEVKKICRAFSQIFEIKYLNSKVKGLSYCRNKGLLYANGEIIAFPDDDCEYKKDTLRYINKLFNLYNKDVLIFNYIDKNTKKSNVNISIKDKSIVNLRDVIKVAVSITIFIKYKNIRDIIFDENLGVGSQFPSGEETDMLLNLINYKYNLFYISKNLVYHPNKNIDFSRAYKYGLGFGAMINKEIIIRKHLRYVFTGLNYIICRPAMGMIASLFMGNINKLKSYFLSCLGRLKGFFMFKI